MKSHNLMAPTSRIDLEALIFAAKIDFATFKSPGRLALPTLDGTVHWGRKDHFRSFTLHDPSPNDIAALTCLIGPLPLLEVEFAVDIRPDDSVPINAREGVLTTVMVDLFARCLDPRDGQAMLPHFRAFYRPGWAGIGPFNLRLPLPSDQQLHGHKSDDAQVKCYLKYRDQGKPLPETKWVARVEARLTGQALITHGLLDVSDLNGFAYRKRLAPYFRHIAGVRPMVDQIGTPMGAVLCLAHDKFNADCFDEIGVGAFLKGGR